MRRRVGWRFDSRFALILAGFAVLLWVGFRDEVMGWPLLALRVATAEAVTGAARLMGMDAVRQALVVGDAGGFAIEISRGCTGFVGAAMLAVAIAAYPVSGRARWWGAAVCVPAFLGLNLIRMVHLLFLGVHRPALFPLAHETLWQAAMIAAVFVLWLSWRWWAGCYDLRATKSVSKHPSRSSASLPGESAEARASTFAT